MDPTAGRQPVIAVGIDPGKRTGVAVWDCSAQDWVEIRTMDFWQCYNHVSVFLKNTHEKIFAKIEDPRGNKPVFSRGQQGRKNLKIAQNVGMNKREAGLLIEGFRKAGVPVMPVTPSSSKWSKKMFKNITGYKGRTSQHARDAAKLVVGLRALPDLQWQKMMDELETEAN